MRNDVGDSTNLRPQIKMMKKAKSDATPVAGRNTYPGRRRERSRKVKSRSDP